jgi:hypothetical protein
MVTGYPHRAEPRLAHCTCAPGLSCSTTEGSDPPLKAMFRFMLLALATLMAFDWYFFGGVHIKAAEDVARSMLQHFGR